MFRHKENNTPWLIIAGLLAGVFFFSHCIQGKNEQQYSTAANTRFAGSEACKDCHKSIYEQHLQSFHHLTSAVASEQTIRGSFSADSNRFYYNPTLYIAAEKKDNQFFQTAYKNDKAQVSRPFDFVVGSGKRGQTFLYWYQDYIFQLPLTYFTSLNEWTNSPGYSTKVVFNRPVTARCLECHSTYLKETTAADAKADQFSKQGIILGVECEKCHGPAAEHVSYQQQHPSDKQPHAILNPGKFSRIQQMDLCRLCHGGKLSKSQPSFSFKTGDRLADYFKLDTATKNIADIDVHGNQDGMLKASRCFINSSMTCITCHDAHKNQAKDNSFFNAKCLTCHQATGASQCKLAATENPAFLKENCIDCHMPEMPSKAIMVLRQRESVPTSAYMRSHYIAVYKEISNMKLEQTHSLDRTKK